jgi:hypothetical protein
MNEILAVIMVALSAELIFGEMNNELENATEAQQVFRSIHDPKHLFADLFGIFAGLMKLGVKDFFNMGQATDVSQQNHLRVDVSGKDLEIENSEFKRVQKDIRRTMLGERA